MIIKPIGSKMSPEIFFGFALLRGSKSRLLKDSCFLGNIVVFNSDFFLYVITQLLTFYHENYLLSLVTIL